MKKKTIMAVLAGVLAVGIVFVSQATVFADSEYTVKKGDSLWKIAKTFFGKGQDYTKIVDANKSIIKDPNLIRIGWKLIIPGESQEPEAEGGLANVVSPITEYKTLSEMNEAAGTILMHPGVMGVTNEKFIVINDGTRKIAEYSFEINGVSYVLRNGPTSLDDISGVYVNGATAFDGRDPADGIDYVFTDDLMLGRWFRVEGQFILSAKKTEGYTEELFKNIAEEILEVNAIQQEVWVEEEYADPLGVIGTYMDGTSQRAVMEVTFDEKEMKYHMTVSWANSAFSRMEWKMSGEDNGYGAIEYNDCVKSRVDYDEKGEKEVYKTEYTGGSGFFSFKDGKLAWDGAQDENCRECAFEKMPE